MTGSGDTNPTPDVEVWIGISGTSAECTCGWRSSMPAGILPQVVTAAVEAHCAQTGHRWLSEADRLGEQ